MLTHYFTPDPTKRFCTVCGDNDLGSVWGIHRFQVQPSDPDFDPAKAIKPAQTETPAEPQHKDDCEMARAYCTCGALWADKETPAPTPPPSHAATLREAFTAGFIAHPNATGGWDFDADTCAAADMEPSAWAAWKPAPPAAPETE